MKRVFFLTMVLLALLVCGTAFAGDITGKYLRGETDSIVIAKVSGNEYSVTVLADDGTGRPEGGSEFKGTGKVDDGVLVVTNQEKVQDREWVNGKLIDKPTFRTVSGTLKIYLKAHSDFQSADDFLRKELSTIKSSQIAIIEEPVVIGVGDGVSQVEFYSQGIPDLSGVYTKK